MLDESLRRRLEALNREQLPRAAAVAPRPVVARPASVPAMPASGFATAKLDPLLARAEVVANGRGKHARITLPVAEIWPAAERLLRGRHEELSLHGNASPAADIAKFLAAFPSRFLALDLETCGLSGSPLFLVGLLREADGQLVVELLLARTYAEEAAVLVTLGGRLAEADLLLTFNGKSFDWPLVGDRWRRHLLDREQPLPALAHLDVLHPARRRWRRHLPDCKLQTIERLVCRRSRTGDIPGHLIPAAYDRYVRTGDPREMEQVLYHNAVDLVTLIDIAMRVAG